METNIEIKEDYIHINEMTRCGEKRKFLNRIIIVSFESEDIKKYIENLKFQDNVYLSYNYVLLKDGSILHLVPDNEITYPTSNIELNLEVLSIGVYCTKQSRIRKQQIKKLKHLIKYLCLKYNLNSKKDVIIEYDINSTRNFSYYIDNYYLIKQIL